MSQLDQLAAGSLVRSRPWDVIGAALAAPMVVWGFLGWFGTVGDSGGGQPGFYAGTGAAGIALVLAAASLALNQILSGRPHERNGPPIAVFLAAAASIVVLGGIIAKPDSITIQAGSIAGLLTAVSQGVVLVLGWLQGSEKTVKASNVRQLQAQQDAADRAAASPVGYPGQPYQGQPYQGQPYQGQPYRGGYPQGPYPQGQPGAFAPGQYPQGQPAQYPQAPAPRYPQAQYPYPQSPNQQGYRPPQ